YGWLVLVLLIVATSSEGSETQFWDSTGRTSAAHGRRLRVCLYSCGQGCSSAWLSAAHDLSTFPDLDEVYRCAELPPLFSNRVMSPSRPGFRAHLAEFALSVQDNEPFTVLAR